MKHTKLAAACLLVCLLVFHSVLALLSCAAVEVARESGALPDPAKSHTGRFYALASDKAIKLVMLRWAEEIAGRVERLVGYEADFGASIVRITVRTDAAGKPGRVELSHDLAYGRVVHGLTLCNLDGIEREDADEALCRVLIGIYALPWSETPAVAPTVPGWISRGLARNLYPARRALDSREALRRWEEGKIPTIADFLRLAPDRQAADRETSAMLLAWLLSQPNEEDIFKSLVKQLAQGGKITSESIVSAVPDCDSTGDLEDKWDRWLLRQRRIVHEPGELYPEHISRLKAELLIYPEVSGIRVDNDEGRALRPRDLIALENRRELAEVARLTSERLRALSVGRGKELAEVVDAYCRFFDALAPARTRGRLEKLLDEAEKKLIRLESELEARESGSAFSVEPAVRENE